MTVNEECVIKSYGLHIKSVDPLLYSSQEDSIFYEVNFIQQIDENHYLISKNRYILLIRIYDSLNFND